MLKFLTNTDQEAIFTLGVQGEKGAWYFILAAIAEIFYWMRGIRNCKFGLLNTSSEVNRICLPFVVQIWIYSITQQLKYLRIRSRSLYWVQLALQKSSTMYINRIKGIDAQWIYFQLVFFDTMFSLNWISLYCFFIRCLLLCSRSILYGVSFFLSASLVNKPCCFHSPYIIVRNVPSFPVMLKCAYAKLDWKARSMCSSLQVRGMWECRTTCVGSRGPDLTVALYLQGELPGINTWCGGNREFLPAVPTQVCTSTRTYTRIAGSGP